MKSEFKVIGFAGTADEFMKTKQFKKEINEPAKKYYDDIYRLATGSLSETQKKLYDEWWNGSTNVSDECYWKNLPVPEGYEWCTATDIKIANDAILYTCSMGCG